MSDPNGARRIPELTIDIEDGYLTLEDFGETFEIFVAQGQGTQRGYARAPRLGDAQALQISSWCNEWRTKHQTEPPPAAFRAARGVLKLDEPSEVAIRRVRDSWDDE